MIKPERTLEDKIGYINTEVNLCDKINKAIIAMSSMHLTSTIPIKRGENKIDYTVKEIRELVTKKQTAYNTETDFSAKNKILSELQEVLTEIEKTTNNQKPRGFVG